MRLTGAIGICVAVFAPFGIVNVFRQAPAKVVIKQLPPSAFPELPPRFKVQLETRHCSIPQVEDSFTSDRRPKPTNVISGDFAAKGQTDWAVLCHADGHSSVIVSWGAPTTCPTQIHSIDDSDIEYRTFTREIHKSRPKQIQGWLEVNPDIGPLGSWATPPPEFPKLTHSGIDDAQGNLGGGIFYCSHGHWYTLSYHIE